MMLLLSAEEFLGLVPDGVTVTVKLPIVSPVTLPSGELKLGVPPRFNVLELLTLQVTLLHEMPALVEVICTPAIFEGLKPFPLAVNGLFTPRVNVVTEVCSGLSSAGVGIAVSMTT